MKGLMCDREGGGGSKLLTMKRTQGYKKKFRFPVCVLYSPMWTFPKRQADHEKRKGEVWQVIK